MGKKKKKSVLKQHLNLASNVKIFPVFSDPLPLIHSQCCAQLFLCAGREFGEPWRGDRETRKVQQLSVDSGLRYLVLDPVLDPPTTHSFVTWVIAP